MIRAFRGRRVFPVEEMTCWPVSPRVGNVKNNDPSLIEPIAGAG
jgi:putative SOS response-associated peptidase YedK